MISDELLKYISEVFIGDIEETYPYKSGPELVDFFNRFFDFDDVYQSGFPSRWWYVADKLEALEEQDRINDFFTIILSKRYIMREFKVDEVQAVETAHSLVNTINDQLQFEGFQLIRKDNGFVLIKEDDDLELIGEGGFALVFLRKSDGRVIKKLKDDYMADPSIRSRFKREFEITNSLQDLSGIIRLFRFDEGRMTYEMEKGDYTLFELVQNTEIKRDLKFNIIFDLLRILSEVHKRNIIHRDLSPTNILIVEGDLNVTDFGLGKNFEVIHSHRTMHTNALGQYDYCSPEQMYSLQDGDKRSDVFSLGRIINFILVGNPNNGRHELAQLVNKATSQNSEDRYDSAVEMYNAFRKIMEIKEQNNLKKIARECVQNRELSMELIQYIDTLSGEALCSEIISIPLFEEVLIDYMKQDANNEVRIIEDVENNYRDVCVTFESNDPIASFASSVIQDNDFNFLTKEKSAHILSYIAYSVRRFHAQRIIDGLISRGIDPLLEEVLVS